MDLKTRIQSLLNERGIKSSELESDLGFGSGYISKLNQSTPNANKLLAISNYLEVSLDYLMTGKERTNNFPESYGKLLSKIVKDTELFKALKLYFKLSDAQKKHVIELIELLSTNK